MHSPFEPIRREAASSKVVEALMERIAARSFDHGDRLPSETELARQFGVNRSTIREALRELQTCGLLKRERGSKLMMVTRPSTEIVAQGVSRALVMHDVTFLDIWESMSILEPSIAETAARRRTAEDATRLEWLWTRFVEDKDDSARCVHHVAEFFSALAQATHNPVLVLQQQPLIQLLEPSLHAMIDKAPQAHSRIATAQRKVYEAVEAKDAADSRTWMAKHIRDFKRGYEVAGIDLSLRITD